MEEKAVSSTNNAEETDIHVQKNNRPLTLGVYKNQLNRSKDLNL